ncbi:ferredoxin [Frankia sp. CcI49]|nr:ferredoxin [Frankia sp. R43]ONH60947.1 ferredoxin [Frankia sp. CcI49]
MTVAQTGAVTVAIDRGRCIGSGMCVMYAPATFEHDDTAKVVLVEPIGDSPETVENAVDACPTGALALAPAPADDSPLEREQA